METILLEKVKEQLKALQTNIENLPDRIISFSTEEEIVGTWIDGSPLYSKTYIKENLTYTVIDSYRVFDLAADPTANADVVLWAYGAVFDDIDDRWFSLPYNRAYRANNYITPEVYSDSGTIYSTCTITNRTPPFELIKSVVTVYYTKKTN